MACRAENLNLNGRDKRRIMKIQGKILIIILSLLIVVGITSILISRSIATHIIKQQITDNLINTTQSRAKHIETLLEQYKELTQLVSTGVAFRDALNENIAQAQRIDLVNRRIKAMLGAYKEISCIRVLNKEGIIIASSHEDIGMDKSAHEIFLEGKEGTFIDDLRLSPFTHKYVLSISVPILLNNQFAGVLVIDFDVEKKLFKITTDHTGLGQTGEVYLVNKDGYMISPSRFLDEVILKQKVDLKPIEEINHNESSLASLRNVADIVRDYRGIEVLSVHSYIPEMGWILVAEIDTEEAFAPATKLTNSLLLVFAVILFIALLITSFISSIISRSLIKLHKGTEEVIKGNLDFKVAISSNDEIGQLSRAFDEMTTKLKKTREELEEYSKNLEKKVKERTRDLEIDINRRRKIEENLRAEKEFVDTLLDTAQVIILVLDKEGKIIRFNHFMEEVSGYQLEEVKGKSWFDTFLPERDREKIQELFLKAMDDIQTKGNINPIVTKDGQEVEVEWYNKTLKDKDGKTIGLLAIGFDLTKRKELQQALQESKERLSSALEAANEGIWDFNLESGELYLSDNYYRMLGYDPGETTITAKSFPELLHPEDKKQVLQKMQECIEGKTKDCNVEFCMKSKSGNWKWILGRGKVVSRDSKGKALRFLGTYVDITQRKEMEEALRESEEKFYSITSSANDAIFFLDNNGHISYCNKKAVEMFGYNKEEMSGKDLHKLIAPAKYYDDYKKGFRTFQKIGKGPAIGKTLELSALRKNREEFPIALSLSAVKLKGKWNAIGIIRDISAQKETEKRLKELARIDSLSGCYSRGYGLELLDRQIKLSHRSKSPLLLAFLDIDGFKAINDNFGHNEGDRVLKEVVQLFKSTLREVDIICRMGGDEFLLIFPHNSLKDAPLIRERLNKNLTKLNHSLNKAYKIELSIGFSEYNPDNPQPMDELIRMADKRMYEEKRNKK